MQKIIIASSLVAVVGLTAIALSRTGRAAAPDAEPSRTVTLAVDGMDCAACPITVRMGLERLEGVEVDRVDIAAGTMDVIVTDDAVTDDQLLQAVANTGYHAAIGGKPEPQRAARADAPAGRAADLPAVSADLEPLRTAFNEARGEHRILAVVSPTCSACVLGVDAIQTSILAPADRDLRVFLVWSPMLASDNEQIAREAAADVRDPRVDKFLDLERHVGSALRRDLFPQARAAMLQALPPDHWFREYAETSDADKPEWDIYLSFPPDATWDDRVPEPDRWIRQTALFPTGAGQRTSLLWMDDYAVAPVEADLVETMARLLP